MSLSFLSSKSWHVARNSNIEAVNAAERAAKAEERRAQQRRQELDAETHWLEMKLLEAPEEQKDKVKAEASLRFLYAPPPGFIEEEKEENSTTDKSTTRPIAGTVEDDKTRRSSIERPPERSERLEIKPVPSRTSSSAVQMQESIKEMLKGLSTEEKRRILAKFEREEKEKESSSRKRVDRYDGRHGGDRSRRRGYSGGDSSKRFR
ncbi:hypothetical protein P9112_008178 [Eukaryota sp. TZLM1-RC]